MQVHGSTVKAPGQVTLTCYAAVTNINKTVTPDIKHPGSSILVYIDLGFGKARLGRKFYFLFNG
jgi:phosphoribosylformylglycinamidine synthase